MSRKINKKSPLIPTRNNSHLRVHPYNQRYDLRPRLNRVNYSEVRPQRQRHLSATISLDGQGDPLGTVKDFVNENIDDREIPTPEYMSPPESDNDFQSSINATVADDRKSIKEEIEETINDTTSNGSVEGEEEELHSANATEEEEYQEAQSLEGEAENEEGSDNARSEILENAEGQENDSNTDSESQSIASSSNNQARESDSTFIVDGWSDVEEDEENFQRNYSASVFDYQELVGNPTMLNLAPRSSQSAIRNNTDPVDDIRNIDHFAGGDGLHNDQTNVIEISIRILNEEDESDRE